MGGKRASGGLSGWKRIRGIDFDPDNDFDLDVFAQMPSWSSTFPGGSLRLCRSMLLAVDEFMSKSTALFLV